MILRSKDHERLINIFNAVNLPIEVWAFGSRVTGEAHEGSDLDLVIIHQNHNKIPSAIFSDLKDKIQQSNIPIIVELFDWMRLPEKFQNNIRINHEVLYSGFSEVTANEPNEQYVERKG